jgi:hypothetical protein
MVLFEVQWLNLEGALTGRIFSELVEIFYVLICLVVTQMYTLIRSHQDIHLRWVHFIVYKLNLNKKFLKFTHDII